MFKEICESLDKIEKEFIYNSLEIENSSEFSKSNYRFWFNDFRENYLKRSGDIYEFGVYRGGSLLAMALLSKRLGSTKHIWGFDSFEGFPRFSKQDNLNNFTEENGFSKEHIEDVHLLAKIRQTKNIKKENLDSSLSKLGKSGLFQNTSFEYLQNKIEELSLTNITLLKGDFKDTVRKHFFKKNRSIFSANIDCDLYEGYKLCLPIVFESLEIGGIINLDEYYSLKYPGAKIATDEFLIKNRSAFLIKSKTRLGEFPRYQIKKK